MSILWDATDAGSLGIFTALNAYIRYITRLSIEQNIDQFNFIKI